MNTTESFEKTLAEQLKDLSFKREFLITKREFLEQDCGNEECAKKNKEAPDLKSRKSFD